MHITVSPTAHAVLNRVPYQQNGHVPQGNAPMWDGKRLDFAAWDARFGPLDGSAFADLPRKNVPLELFYLPLHENWPTPIEPNYNGDYWADRAFPAAYRAAFVAATRRAEHFAARGWNDTLFHGFLNGKNNSKGARLVARVVAVAARRACPLPGLLGRSAGSARRSTRGERGEREGQPAAAAVPPAARG